MVPLYMMKRPVSSTAGPTVITNKGPKRKTKTYLMLEKMIETTYKFKENFSMNRQPKYLVQSIN